MTLHELIGLPCGEGEIVSLCGSGGKTTVMCLLSEESRRTAPTAMFTTTHLFPPVGEHIRTLIPFDERECRRAWEAQEIVFSGTVSVEGKYTGPDEAAAAFLLREARAVYIEADGSRRLPMKYPNREKEPVLRQETTHTVALIGMNALHRPTEKVFHRVALAREHMDIPDGPVTEELMARVLWAGYGDLDPIFFVNQADTPQRQESADRICSLLRSYGAKRAVFGAARDLLPDGTME